MHIVTSLSEEDTAGGGAPNAVHMIFY